MEPSETHSEPHRGTAFRRGKQLAPILTSFDTKLPTRLERPRPVETVIYEKPSRNSAPESKSPLLQRRISRGGLRSLFSRTKSTKDVKEAKRLQSTVEEVNAPTSPVKAATHSLSSAGNGRSSFNPDSSSTSMRVVTPTSRQRHVFQTTTSTQPVEEPSRKERPMQSLKTWNPPPLFQAYPQAIKHCNLPAPVCSVDVILKMEKQRHINEKKHGLSQTIANVGLEQNDEEMQHESDTAKGHKARKSDAAHIEWTSKVYVLATSGFLLQYAGDGNFDRLPEKILQLGKDSAAFASDVIPGKHWVLQILQASDEAGAATNSLSVLSRLGFGGERRRLASSLLLILDSPEEMNSWLVAVRKEIEALGGKRYRPDVGLRKTTDEVIQQLRDKPSRRYLVKRDPNRFSSSRPPQSMMGDISGSEVMEEFMCTNPAAQGSPNLDRHNSLRPAPSIDTASMTLVPEGTLVDGLRRNSRSSYASSQTKISATPFTTSPNPSPLKTDFMDDTLYTDSSGGFTFTALDTMRRRSFQNSISRTSDGRPSFDLKPSTLTTRPLSTNSSSTHCSASPVATNFSVPNFSKRTMHPGHPSQLPTPPASAGTTHRSLPPNNRDEFPERPDSVLGELPMLRASLSAGRSRASLKPDSSSAPPVRTSSGLNASPKAPITFHSHSDRPVPRRFSSLEYSTVKLPLSHLRQNLSPHPPPTTALPALPPPDPSFFHANSRPTSPRSAASHKLRRPASMQVRNSPLPQLRSSSSQARMHSTASSCEYSSAVHMPLSLGPTPSLTSLRKGDVPSVPVVKISESSPQMRERGWAEYGGIELGATRVKVS